jgi:hypothetical protein
LSTTKRCANGDCSAPKWKRENFGARKTIKIVESAIQTAAVAEWVAKIGDLWE